MDAELISISEWCEGEKCEGIEYATQILITSNDEIFQYCDKCGEEELQRERDKS